MLVVITDYRIITGSKTYRVVMMQVTGDMPTGETICILYQNHPEQMESLKPD